MKKIYKIAEFQHFFKYVKKNDSYIESKNFSFSLKDFETRKAAEEYIQDKENNYFPFGNPAGAHYEKIADNTFKLTYADTKTYRIISYQICEFYDVD